MPHRRNDPTWHACRLWHGQSFYSSAGLTQAVWNRWQCSWMYGGSSQWSALHRPRRHWRVWKLMLQSGVPEGSVLCPRLLIEYAEGRITHLRPPCMIYVIICLPTSHNGDVTMKHLERCVADVADWCAVKRLLLNVDKTELLCFGSTSLSRRLSPNNKTITVDRNAIKAASCVRNLGVSGVSTKEDRGTCPPRFQAEGDSHAKVPHFFDTQWYNSRFYKLKSRLTGLCV